MADTALGRITIRYARTQQEDALAMNTLGCLFQVAATPGPGGSWVDTTAAAAALVSPLNTWWASIKTYMESGMTPSSVTVSTLNPTTLEVDDQGAAALTGTANTGASGAAQIAMAVTLHSVTPGSFTPHPARHRGRIFLGPLAASIINSAGVFGGSPQSDIQAATKVLLNAIRGISLGTSTVYHMLPSIVSRVDRAGYPIVGLSTDGRPDVQRRRANQIKEARTYLAL